MLQFTGHIHLPVTGLWSFILDSDDGSLLYIDGAILINNNGVYSPPHSPAPPLMPWPTFTSGDAHGENDFVGVLQIEDVQIQLLQKARHSQLASQQHS